MKRIIMAVMLVVLPLSLSARIQLYSRALEEKRVADSLRAIDSVRIADSIRVADSNMVKRYRNADADLKKEKEQKIADNRKYAAVTINPAERIKSEKVDNVSARSIVIDPKSPYAGRIDSLQAIIDAKSDSLYDGDKWFKKMKIYPVSEKTRYMEYLMKNRMKDTTDILACCNSVFELYKLKHEMLLVIREAQDANMKSFVSFHIEEHLKKMGELSQFIVRITPVLPSYPQHGSGMN